MGDEEVDNDVTEHGIPQSINQLEPGTRSIIRLEDEDIRHSHNGAVLKLETMFIRNIDIVKYTSN
jgi:hypothetical protein